MVWYVMWCSNCSRSPLGIGVILISNISTMTIGMHHLSMKLVLISIYICHIIFCIELSQSLNWDKTHFCIRWCIPLFSGVTNVLNLMVSYLMWCFNFSLSPLVIWQNIFRVILISKKSKTLNNGMHHLTQKLVLFLIQWFLHFMLYN